ncbi:o-spanin [Stenotrophomonas phage Ptah]|uniref:O-spanin n=1 Tax=Stenotrophomonas phage Ptah TaxID=2859657 RepID=A0AAE7WLP2_9CAUD|nr:o-spanin [Stenotrophomonas phage Ptah]
MKYGVILKLTLSGLTLLFLMTLLQGCGIAIPKQWLEPCRITYAKDGTLTNADVYQLAIDREFDTRACNADKAALRAYIEAHPKLRLSD